MRMSLAVALLAGCIPFAANSLSIPHVLAASCVRPSGTELWSSSDGNPPPFGDYSSWSQPTGDQGDSAVAWGQPAPSPPPAESSEYSTWGHLTPVTSPTPASTWGQPAPAPSQSIPNYSSWGQSTTSELVGAKSSTAMIGDPELSTPVTSVSSTGNPIEELASAQSLLVDKIAASIPDLIQKEGLCWDGKIIGGNSATIDARDAPGASNVAWFASVTVDSIMSSLTIFNGPLTDVPHILSRCVFRDGYLELAVDVRPRAYGAYELRDASGNYPGPEELGRKAFEYSGARNDYFGKFANQDIESLLSIDQFEGADLMQLSELDTLTGGPTALHARMLATASNIQKVASVRESIVLHWLRWVQEGTHEHRPGAPVNTQYVYDAKFRQNAYSALLPYYSDIFGPTDGAALAAGESGPLDEAYVGGGS